MKLDTFKKIIVAAAMVATVSANVAVAETKQKIKKLDSTVVMENAGAGSIAVMGGKATTVIGGASVTNGATQDIGDMKTSVRMKNAGAGSITVMGGTATTNIGGAVAD